MVESCAVVTTVPNARLAEIHDRTPVLVAPDEREVWLDGSVDEVRHGMRPFEPARMRAWACGPCRTGGGPIARAAGRSQCRV